MRKAVEYLKENEWIIYLVIFLVMFYKHMNVQLGVDDDVWFLEQSQMGWLDFTCMRIRTWTSRNIIELCMIILLNLSPWVWMLLDSLIFLLIFHSIKKIVMPVKAELNIAVEVLLALVILLFPFERFGETGWYATTLNYSWPLAFGLYGLSFICRIMLGEKTTNIQVFFAVLAAIYAVNQEQTCALYIGFYGLFIGYCLLCRIKLPTFVYVVFLISLSMLCYHLICPGNAARKAVETQVYYPAYGRFSVMDKLFLGVITTISIGFLRPCYMIFLWNAVILYAIVKKNGSRRDVIWFSLCTLLNLFISIVDRFDTVPILRRVFWLFAKFTTMVETIDYSQESLYLIILYFVLVVLYYLWVIKKCYGNQLFGIIAVLFLAAFCSRVVLGFSASIFASGMRTFINSYFLIIVASFICLYDTVKERTKSLDG